MEGLAEFEGGKDGGAVRAEGDVGAGNVVELESFSGFAEDACLEFFEGGFEVVAGGAEGGEVPDGVAVGALAGAAAHDDCLDGVGVV